MTTRKKPQCKAGNKPCGLICISQAQKCHRDMLEPQADKVANYKKGLLDEGDLSSALVNDPEVGIKLPKETALIVADSDELSDQTKKRYFASASREWNIPHSMGSNPKVGLKTPDVQFTTALHARGVKHYGEEVPEDKKAKKKDKKEFTDSQKWKLAAMGIFAATGVTLIAGGLAIKAGQKEGAEARAERGDLSSHTTAEANNTANQQAGKSLYDAGVLTSDEARQFQVENEIVPKQISAREDFYGALEKGEKFYSRFDDGGPEMFSARDKESFEELFGYSVENAAAGNVEDFYGSGTIRHSMEDAIVELGGKKELEQYVLERKGALPRASVPGYEYELSAEEAYINRLDSKDVGEILPELEEQFNARLSAMNPDRLLYAVTKDPSLQGKYSNRWEKSYVAGNDVKFDSYLAALDEERRQLGDDFSSEFNRPIGGNKFGSYVDPEDRKYAKGQMEEIDATYDPSSLAVEAEIAKSIDQIDLPDDAVARAEMDLKTYDPQIDAGGAVLGSSDEARKDDIGAGVDDTITVRIRSEGDGRLKEEQRVEQEQLWKILPDRLYTEAYHNSINGNKSFEEGRAEWIQQRVNTPAEAEFVSDMLSQGISKYGLILEEMKADYGTDPKEVLGSSDEAKKVYKTLFRTYRKQLENKVKLGVPVLPFFVAVETPGEITLKDGQDAETYQYDPNSNYVDSILIDEDEFPSSLSQLSNDFNFSELTKVGATALIRALKKRNTIISTIHKLNYNPTRNDLSAVVTTKEGNTLYAYLSPTEVFTS